jgi:hypothetical protein
LAIIALVIAVLSLLIAVLSLLLQVPTLTGRFFGSESESVSPQTRASLPSTAPSGADPVFTLKPLPPTAARDGAVETFEASGTSNGITPVFTLSTSSVGGGMGNNGAFAIFWLVPAGQPFDETAPPAASCTSPCASGGWGSAVSPGDYYLVIQADDRWTFALSQGF